MANLINTLYPPQIPTYQSAFLTTETCKVYFSLSQYNSYEEIKKNAQVTISNQNTNQSVLSLDKYNNEIKLCQVRIDESKDSDKYYIEISPQDLQNGFEINQYYKVQIRFTSIYAPEPPSSALDKWLVDNVDYFSEWSTICLIRAISTPTLSLQNFPSNNDVVIQTSNLNIIGALKFSDPTETDSLNYYQIKLFNDNKELLVDSGIIYTNDYNNPNGLNYSLKYKLQNGSVYYLQVDIATKNYYFNTYSYNFAVLYSSTNPLNAIVTAENEEENGRVKIVLSNTTTDKYKGKVIIKRASSADNFCSWETIHTINFVDSSLVNLIWYDKTIESGIWYKYSAQKEDSYGNLGTSIETEPVLAFFEDMFINAGNKQLRIKYDQNVNSLKQNIVESRAETLGSKYPFIIRNGYVNYRSMTISGLITFLNDEQEEFLSEKEIYQDSYDLYKEYNEKNRITDYNNYFFEKQFREKVINFLYEDNIKLLRTLTEGNTLVKLMNISLTPKKSLGRYIYSFSAEAYEIDSCSINNYFNYSIIDEEENYNSNQIEEEQDTKEIEKLGQIYGDIDGGKNIIDLIKEKYSNYLRIKDIRFQFQEEVYSIGEDETGKLIPSEENPIGKGYIIYLNNNSIMVSKKGVYQLRNLDTIIDSISFPKNTNVVIDYLIVIEDSSTEKEDDTSMNNSYSSIYYQNIVGQNWGSFDYNNSIYQDIYEKYYSSYSSYKTRLAYIGSIQIEADKNSVFYIQTDTASTPGRYVVNETNLLTLQDKELEVIDIIAGGIHVTKSMNSNLALTASDLYFEEKEKFLSLQAIGFPEDNHVYTVDNQRYIWYNKGWYKINENDDIEVPIEGIINYYCKIIREVYLKA